MRLCNELAFYRLLTLVGFGTRLAQINGVRERGREESRKRENERDRDKVGERERKKERDVCYFV